MTKDPSEKRRPIHIRMITRKHAGKIVQPYKILETLTEEYHEELKKAAILLCWRSGWKPDVDGVLTLARIKKASDLDRAIGSMLGDVYDFVLQLNEEIWGQLSEEQRRMLVDHELYHAAPDLDRNGEQKRDAKERLCWRVRKHPITEFPQIIERYGIEATLKLSDDVLDAREKAGMPLFHGTGDGKALAENKAEMVDPMAWRDIDLASAGIASRYAKKLAEVGIDTLGKLADLQRGHESWWYKEVPGIGEKSSEEITDVITAYLQQYLGVTTNATEVKSNVTKD